MANTLQRTLRVVVAALLLTSTHSISYTIDATQADESTATSPWTGQVKLYKDTNFRSLLITLKFNTANLCFNLACGDIDDAVSSATWKGLPLQAYFSGGTTSLLMFYRGIDCAGVSQGWPTSTEKAADFGAVGINDAASSFMFLQNYTGVHNGIQSICDYKLVVNA
ncbi:hypothetical protein F441_12774 [Phytophthora nicotianae CJ01A1]|uniref:Jacalin-type lectin domain-containing protein n=6 Tax=Phytophthora nicotianae TaxID=4792 RepID=W2PXH8_PHYN3|nr:hypothetical protein PPTG_14351 [Phytophthora nicotianae INRA-310]ETI42002.1 hypothetical protein F443_12815 [Phytophthora nicotianae P1569]ETK82016.1 hypothetical protein L915_12530 [Phytophthora nicotianae]ETP11764.1 hypothetical protein F441_12774 [Phytophthora nicotianae CJ01A1]ETP39855.1 hypothetical protein F442_12726 [Phytophthora nicotianae P10297]ETL35432.1 hypothetical protein L916_12441 [Phytophthora nicotianae]